jgi:flavin-dependent dehydrogenase
LHYDVIVIGAGPGGCMAAKVLSGAGFKVLLVEREKLPREKPCGGFVPPEAVALIEEYFGPLPEDCLAVPGTVRGARLISEGGGAYDLPFSGPGRSVLRSRLDAWLAAACGAEARDGCEVLDFDVSRFHVSVRTNNEAGETEIESTYLIGADGADAMVLRNLRPEFHRVYAAPGLQRTMLVLCGGEVDWDPQWMGLVLLKQGKGLSRFFIKGDLIGLAVNYDSQGGWQGELDALTTFLERTAGLRQQDEAIRMISSSNRMGARGSYNLGAGCALLAGEAAGLLDPWGFGIFPALESGRVAAESLIESAGESITPHIRYRYRMQEWLELDQKQRRKLSGKVGCLETTSLTEDRSRTARRDRRTLRRRLSK